jgi:hypothetical protein
MQNTENNSRCKKNPHQNENFFRSQVREGSLARKSGATSVRCVTLDAATQRSLSFDEGEASRSAGKRDAALDFDFAAASFSWASLPLTSNL